MNSELLILCHEDKVNISTLAYICFQISCWSYDFQMKRHLKLLRTLRWSSIHKKTIPITLWNRYIICSVLQLKAGNINNNINLFKKNYCWWEWQIPDCGCRLHNWKGLWVMFLFNKQLQNITFYQPSGIFNWKKWQWFG